MFISCCGKQIYFVFSKAIEQYNGQIPPQQISCVTEEGIQELDETDRTTNSKRIKVVFEYKCKMVKVVDGDTVDVDIDLGFGVWLRKQRISIIWN